MDKLFGSFTNINYEDNLERAVGILDSFDGAIRGLSNLSENNVLFDVFNTSKEAQKRYDIIQTEMGDLMDLSMKLETLRSILIGENLLYDFIR